MAAEINFEGIGTKWWIKVYTKTDSFAWVKIITEVQQIVKIFEQNYSRFLNTSYISKLNNRKILFDFPAELYEILQLSVAIQKLTNGYFNIGVGKTLENLGYDSNYSFESKNENFNLNLSKELFLSLSSSKIELLSDVKIDLGGIGKGYLIDKIKNYFLNEGLEYFTINGGGDIFSTGKPDLPEIFALQNPSNKTEEIGLIYVKNKAIACSAPNQRQWINSKTGKVHNHLINPITNQSSFDKLAVFTEAKTALKADIASTVLFVAPTNLIDILAQKLETEYLIIFPDENYVASKNYSGKVNT